MCFCLSDLPFKMAMAAAGTARKATTKEREGAANKKQKMKTKDIRRFRLLPPPAHCACSFGILFKMDYAGNDDESSRFNTLKKKNRE